MKVLSVKGWDDNFENNRTRDMVRMQWLPLPNKHDGDGFTDLITRKNGSSLYGAWVLILQVASKCQPRGTLLRDGKKPHCAESLSRITRAKEADLQAAIDACLEIGWLEYITLPDNELDQAAPSCGETAPSPHPTDYGTERKERKERKQVPAAQETAVQVPPELDRPEFKTAWAEWEQHRKQKRVTLTDVALKRQLKKLADMGVERAVAAIGHSIEKNYTGIYEDSQRQNARPPPKAEPGLWDNGWKPTKGFAEHFAEQAEKNKPERGE